MRLRPGPDLLVGATALAYVNSFFGVFQFDDYNVIVNNPAVHSFGAWAGELGRGIRPVLKATYMANRVSGAGLFGFHLVNLLVHLANVVLVFLLSRIGMERLGADRGEADRIAFAAAFLFGLHPVQTEAVTYICGRSTSLMATFYLGALLSYARGSRGGSPALLYVVSPLFFVAALLTKETALTLPAALLLWEKAFGCGTPGILRRQAVHWLLLLCASVALIAHPGYGRLLEFSFDVRSVKANLLGQIGGIAHLVSRLFALSGLNIDPDLPVPPSLSVPLAATGAVLAASVIAGVLLLGKVPWLGFGLLWFFLHLLPTNSIVPRLDVANDRQMYLPVWGLFLVLGASLERAIGAGLVPRRWARSGGVCVLVLLAVFTVMRNRDYRSEVALWEDTVRKSPGKARVHNNLGCAYEAQGRLEKARESYRAALRRDPDYAPARRNLEALLR